MEMIHEGGWTMWLLLLLLLPALGMAVAHAAVSARWTAIAAFALLALVFAVGLLGRSLGRSMTEQAVATVDSDMREQLLEVGYNESSRPVDLAVLIACAVAVPLAIGETRRLSRPRGAA